MKVDEEKKRKEMELVEPNPSFMELYLTDKSKQYSCPKLVDEDASIPLSKFTPDLPGKIKKVVCLVTFRLETADGRELPHPWNLRKYFV